MLLVTITTTFITYMRIVHFVFANNNEDMGWHGGAVFSTIASQQEGPWFEQEHLFVSSLHVLSVHV